MKKTQNATIFIIVSLLFFIFSSPTHAENEETYTVGTDILNVRSAPHSQAEIVGKLTFGDRVPVFDERNGWISTFYNGKQVWVASHFLMKDEKNAINQQTKSNITSTDNNQAITIVADSVRLRSGPSTDHSIIGHASQGDQYQLIETNKDWSQVLLQNGTTVWVASWLTNQTTSTDQEERSSKSATQPVSDNTTNQPLKGYNIVLDPGHGGVDPGAIGLHSQTEKGLALDFTQIIAEKLRNEGATVLLTRSTDTYVSLKDRVRISESYLTDAFISIHFNAFTSRVSNGISTHYYHPGSDQKLAQHIQSALEKNTAINSRGVKHDNYYVLRENNDLSVLVELGFITNPRDVETIKNASYSSNVAQAIFEGLVQHFDE